MSSDCILGVDRLTMRFGGIIAVNDLSFTAERRKITALIGPNGAGKTTVFNCITGFYRASSGTMRLTHDSGKEIRLERLNDFRISKQAKVARTFQNIRLFPGMTALENLMVAQHNALMLASGLTFLGLIGAPSWRTAENGSIALACWTAPTMPPATCLTAISAVWKSHGRCAPSRRCFASTNQPPA
jgi:branched-chain amino acid transport system ATP-binding protein